MRKETIFGNSLEQLHKEAAAIFSIYPVGGKVIDEEVKQKFKKIYDRHPLKQKVEGDYDLLVVKDRLNIRKCFAIGLEDGSFIRFSLKHALKKQNINLRDYLTEVCRDIVYLDIKFRKKHYIKIKGSRCEETGKFYAEDQLDLHHKTPFEFNIICANFLIQNELKLDTDLFDQNNKGDLTFKDKSLINNFRVYHKKYLDSHTCLLHRRVNKSKGTRHKFAKIGNFSNIFIPVEANKKLPHQLDLFDK